MLVPEAMTAAAYWGPRAETTDSCAERLAVCLARLEGVAGVLSSWHEKGSSRADSLARPVVTSPEALLELLGKGRHRADDSGAAMEDLGYAVSWWNGEDAEIRAQIGIRSERMTNVVLLKLGPSSAARAASNATDARDLLAAIADPFDASWGLVKPASLERVPGVVSGRPPAGWVTWLRTAEGERWWTTGPTADSATTATVGQIQGELARLTLGG